MPLIQQVGGSLTTAAALTLLAWGVRALRKKYHRAVLPYFDGSSNISQGQYFCTLSPAALRMLVETDPIPHLVLDIRSPEAVQEKPLPKELSLTTLNLPIEEVEAALAGGESSWPLRLRRKAAPPNRDYMLVFVADGEEQARAAAAAAASTGYQRTAVLEGGLEAFGKSVLCQTNLKYINRDAVALLLGLADEKPRILKALVIDLRRQDERTLYGTIPERCILVDVTGAVHLPTEEFPAALKMPRRKWKDRYRCDKPAQKDVVVMQCRTNRRAAWAAQLAQEAGLQCCFVYRQGAYGWKLSQAVKSYRSYEKWDPPPEPEPFQVEHIDLQAAKAELRQLELLD